MSQEPPPLPAQAIPTRVIVEQASGRSRWGGRLAWLITGISV